MTDYQKNKLLLEEKKGKKKLYKNWKLYASALGIIIIGTGTGLGVYFGVHANNTSANTISNQQIVDEINANNSYNIEVQLNSDINDIPIINASFIKTNLSTKINNAFDDNAFSYTKITVNNVDLKNSDLLQIRTFSAKINYNYDSIINQTTNLSINVKCSSEQMATAISEAEYSLDIPVKTTVNELEKNKITSDFIKNKLTGEFAKAFDANLFHLNKITVNNSDLEDNDLTTVSTINAKINYNYDSITNQTNLTINVIGVDDAQIVNKINNAPYVLTITSGTTAENINNWINSKLIKQKLTGDFDKFFINDYFTVNKITVDDHTLNDNDLKAVNTINAKINYNYGTITKTETNLTINILGTMEEQNIITAMINTDYKITVIKGSAAESLINSINAEFIQDQLFGQIASSFETSKFKLNDVLVNTNKISDNDLTRVGTINAIINFTYGSNVITRWESNLIITIE